MQSPPNSLEMSGQASRRRLSNVIILLIWFGALALVALNRQTIIDWWKLRGYKAPAPIAALASQTTMNDYGRKVFYVNRPALQAKTDFIKSCYSDAANEEKTIVLGCYHGNQNGIYLLSVTDPRLDGVQQVTAAHEMLHGAYDRLSRDERRRIDGLLNNYYATLQDKRILGTIDAYKTSEPNDVTNEMHSIFGTEVAVLPPELENYYKRYFKNRAQVVAFASKYQAVFTSRQAQLKQYKAQLEALKSRIDSGQADLEARQREIETRQADLEQFRQSGNAAAYNGAVSSYNSQVDSYNYAIEVLRTLISQYNQLVAQHNALAQEQGQLMNELDADAATPIE